MVNTMLRIPMLLAASLLVAGCGSDDATKVNGGGDAPELPEDTCASLQLTKAIEEQLGGKPEVLSEKVSTQDDVSTAHCVWSAPAGEISTGGATVEVVLSTGSSDGVSSEWRRATGRNVAPPDWRPATRVESTSVTPKGDWEESQGTDYSHPIAGAGATRLLSVRIGQGDGFVVHTAVRMDARGKTSPAVAKMAQTALTAAARQFE